MCWNYLSFEILCHRLDGSMGMGNIALLMLGHVEIQIIVMHFLQIQA